MAADFFTVEAWARRGLQCFVVLFFLDLSTRRVEIAGVASTVNGLWMGQIGGGSPTPWTASSSVSAI